MNLKSAALALPLSLLLLAPHATFADSLKLTGTGGGSTDGVATFPYIFNVTIGSTTTDGVDLTCLNFNRDIQTGESWLVNTTNLEADITHGTAQDGSSLTALKEDAYLDSLYFLNPTTAAQKLFNSEVQFAIWDILDPTDVHFESGFDSVAKGLVTAAIGSLSTENAAFYLQFTLFTPVVPSNDTDPTNPRDHYNPTDWDGNGEPQQFLEYTPTTTNGVPPIPGVTPEPSSLVLFGTGLLGLTGILRRRMLQTQAETTA